MKLLLPHRYKKIGAVMAPLGFIIWLLMQWGYLTRLLISVFGQSAAADAGTPYHGANVTAAVLGFFSFLAGLYLVAFSKEKVEDEMVKSTRLHSFQFAAFLQLIVTIAGFLFIALAGDPSEGRMMLFFIGLLLSFWVSFIGRFNYMLHFKYRG